MKRWILALAFLLCASLSVAHADYLRIIYILGVVRDSENPSQPGGRIPGGERGPGAQPPNPGGIQPPLPGGRGVQPPLPGGRIPRGGGRVPGPGMQPPPLPGTGPRPGLPQAPQQPPTEREEDDDSVRAEVVVEFKKLTKPVTLIKDQSGLKVQYPKIRHKYGETAFTTQLPDIRLEVVKENNVVLPPVAERYQNLRNEKLKGGKTAEALLELAEWALNHAMLDDFTKLMDELREVQPSNPSLQAYDKVAAGLKARVAQDDVAITWQARLGNLKVKRSPHYAVIYNAAESEPGEVLDYIARLEDNLRGFYYWFALKTKVLPIPTKRLVVAVLDKPDEVLGYRQAFDNPPLVADGFYSRPDNLAICSSVRLDEAFDLLTKATNPLWQTGWNMDELLQAKGHPGATSADEVIRNQMLALLQKAMQDESVLATVSHVGTRQLEVAAGLVPRDVAVPEWVQFGAASFFETPTGAFWPGIGAPSWKYGVKFKLWSKLKKLDPAETAIHYVLTDHYFREHSKEDKKDLMKARTMSWSLAFFLMNRKLDQFLRYFQELNRLPRDMQLDDDALLLAFGRAFDLVDPSAPDRIDPVGLDKLAKEWYSFIELTPIESSEAVQDAVKEYNDREKKKKNEPAQQKPKDKQPPKITLPKITLPKGKGK